MPFKKVTKTKEHVLIEGQLCKICSKCKIFKPLTSFKFRSGKYKSLLHSWCVECKRSYDKKSMQEEQFHPLPIEERIMKKKQHYRDSDSSRLKLETEAAPPDKVSLKEKIFVGVVAGLITAVLCVPPLISLHKTEPPVVPIVEDKVSIAEDSDLPTTPPEKPPVSADAVSGPGEDHNRFVKLDKPRAELSIENFIYVELNDKYKPINELTFKFGVPQEQCIPVVTEDGYRVMCDGKLLP